ncbi:hypothetical protein LLH06_09775 [Mucilaginibacter daejeonensis]|uniref:hypothetical protein n=1 Tax=Mucilaginibacter daejeonensis TaxID=398049 RepID=UPI001D177294|nr:hypothetical protein [Mucilaginibacter daejeonensis]UEG55247.1 hypothetical protein LLH06_09775 [Mucilaginibacter daejeonensis]
MKRLIIITVILIAATVMVTVTYFKNLNPPGLQTTKVINAIPPSAALIFEFNNEASFYDAYDKNQLFATITGAAKMRELHTLRKALLNNELIRQFYDEQDVFISLHASPGDSLEYLITVAAKTPVAKQIGVIGIKQMDVAGKKGFSFHVDTLQKDLYLAEKGNNIWMASFSKPLLEEGLNYKPQDKDPIFEVFPDQQHATTLATLYINYTNAGELVKQFYRRDNVELWSGLSTLPATSALSLNFKSDAFMFSGFTQPLKGAPGSYLELFKTMKPVEMHLKDLFPLTTAYSTSYGFDNVEHFIKALHQWQHRVGFDKDKKALFGRIKQETGVQLDKEFDLLLDNEFAVLTTRFQEKLAIIKMKNGASLRPFLFNVSNMTTDNIGQFKYDQIPLFLIGDALVPFRRPYFTVIDNYLVLGTTQREVSNFSENYFNNEFLSKRAPFIAFNDLLPQRSNINYFIHFKNAGYVFKRLLKPDAYKAYERSPGLSDHYAGAYQLAASDKEFYTNFCIQLNQPDSTLAK